MTDQVEFNHDDETLVDKITDRWVKMHEDRGNEPPDILHTMMDIKAANGVNGNARLDLWKLLEFRDGCFAHDMGGISRHIDRATGTIGGCFLPRCVISELEIEKTNAGTHNQMM